MSYVAYKSLLSDIRRQLELHDHQQLLEMCGLDDEAANIHDTRSLMRRLEEKKRFTIDELGDLEEVLESLEEFSLLGKLKKFESKRKEYNDLLEKISGALNDDERNHMEQVINIVKRETSVDFSRENIPSILTLFQKLQKHGSLGFRRLNFVKRILTEIDKEDLVREIEDYEKRRNKKDASERRKAEWYSWGKSFARKVKGVSLKTACRVGKKLLHFADILVNWESMSQFIRSFNERVLPADTELVNVGEGCVYFTVQANSIKGLTTLWNMYQDGTLKARLHDFLVTDEVKHLVDAEENVELTVTIEKEEYDIACIDLNNEAKGDPKQTQGRKRRYSDSELLLTANEDDASPTKLKRLENDVELLKENIENQEKQLTRPLDEFFETYMASGILPGEQESGLGAQAGFSELEEDLKESGLGAQAGFSELEEDLKGKRETQHSINSDEWMTLINAIKTDNIDIIEASLSHNLDINSRNNKDYTLLMIAAIAGKNRTVHYLLGKGADPSLTSKNGANALHIASLLGHVNIIETLLSSGLNINQKSSDGKTPLILSCCQGLKRGADAFAKGFAGRNVLHFASYHGSVTLIDTVLSFGVDVNSKDDNGLTALQLAQEQRKTEAVNFLLSKGGRKFFSSLPELLPSFRFTTQTL